MTSIRNFVSVLVVFFCAGLLNAQSDAVGDQRTTFKPTFTTIDVPGAFYTNASAINTGGTIVGSYGQDTSTDAHGFSYSGGVFSYFDYPDGQNWTIPRGINDSQLIVGYADQNPVIGFLYDGASFTTIKDGNNTATFSGGINNAGIVVGGAGTVYTTRGFEELNGRYKAVNFPGLYVYGYAAAINDLGVVVGTADDSSYIFNKGRFTNINVPGATRTAALGISDAGITVGWYFSTSCNCSFAYKNGKYLTFSYPGAVFTAASGINKLGQVVGQYTFDYQSYHGFLTSPITGANFR